MRFSLSRLLQWGGIAVVLLAVVGLNYDFNSEARVQMNTSVEDPLSQGMRGYWKMDTGSGTSAVDASGNANNLSFTGSPSWVTGNIGPSALDFSGTGQYLSVASPASGILDFVDGASFSLTGWFNRDTFAADHTIIAKRNGQAATDDGYIVYIDDSTDTLVFEASDTADGDEYQRVSSSTFTAAGWHQFAVTWNDSATTDPVNIYIDGGINNGTATGTFANIGSLVESVAFRIGAESDAGNPFDGKLDDIRIYGYPLSAGDVLKLYQTTAPAQPVDTGLVGHWTFDGPDIAGTTVMDRSSYGNNGTATGTTKTIGKLGQGLQFNGVDDVVSVNGFGTLTNTYSFSFWANPETKTTGYGYSKFFTTYYFWLAMNDSDCDSGELSFYYNTTDHCSNGANPIVYDSGWHHIVVTSNAGSVVFYVDGQPNGTATGALALRDYISVAEDEYSSDHYYQGKIDDFRWYNRVLSSAEVANLYSSGK